MNSQIIQEIALLKQNYQNHNNTYEINYSNITKQDFINKLQNIKKHCNNIKIIDNKEYINRDLILTIDMNGNMKCINKRMLKYKVIDNIRIDLFNENQINTDNFGGNNYYQDVYKQKKIIFEKDSFTLSLIMKTRKNDSGKKEEDKVFTIYDLKISFKSTVNEKELEKIFSML